MNLLDSRVHDRILEKKKRLDAHRPFPPSTVRKLQEQMQIEYIYHSNAIEGNTLNLRETQLILEEGITIDNKSLREHLEVRNHPRAIRYVERIAMKELKEEHILSLHQIVMKGIDNEAGRYRKSEVRIAGSRHVPPPAYEVPHLITEAINWHNTNPDELRPIELAAAFHHKFEHIHPFRDGNGRVGRLLMNLALMRREYPIAMIQKADRKKYLQTMEEADKGNLVPLVGFIAAAAERSLEIHLRAIEPSKEDDRLMTLAEASRISPYSQEYLGLLARKRRIGAVKEGRRWMITPRALERYLTEIRKENDNASRRLTQFTS